MLHILLLGVILLPVAGRAQEETMAERRQRLMRKYLHERADVSDSGIELPDYEAQGRRIMESERFIAPEADLSRDRSAAPAPRPRPMRRNPQQNENWLLSTEDVDLDELYRDPFAVDAEEEPADSARSGYDRLSLRERDALRRESTEDRNRNIGSQRSRDLFDANAQADETASAYNRYEGVYGAPSADSESERTTTYPGMRTYGNTPTEGMLESPFGTRTGRRDEADESRSGTYTPRTTPRYDSKSRYRSAPPPGGQDADETFRRTQPFQQWKDRKKDWDPTADDAYLDELMRRN